MTEGQNSKKMYVPTAVPSDAKPRRFSISTLGFALSVNDSPEYKLRQELLSSMDVMVRPVTSNSEAVDVSFSLTVWALVDLVCLCLIG